MVCLNIIQKPNVPAFSRVAKNRTSILISVFQEDDIKLESNSFKMKWESEIPI